MQKPFTIPEAAKQIGLSTITIRRMIYTKKISYRKIGARYFFTEADLTEFVEASRHPMRCQETAEAVQ
jgi:excisionase family DNA binding protein